MPPVAARARGRGQRANRSRPPPPPPATGRTPAPPAPPAAMRVRTGRSAGPAVKSGQLTPAPDEATLSAERPV